MIFDNIQDIKQDGFRGFLKVKYLMATECDEVDNRKGVYLVVRDFDNPVYLSMSVGGHYKSKDPTVPISTLETNWVDDAVVVYIGQAGRGKSKATLRKRLGQYMCFGEGDPVRHWGGRLIWQLDQHKELIVCWKPTGLKDAREVEKKMIADFKGIYGKRPFANLQD